VKSSFHRRRSSDSILLALGTLACFANSTIAKDVDIAGIVRQTKLAVVQIVAFDPEKKPLRSGTGFFISANGDLLTNYHVVSGASSILAKAPGGAIYSLRGIVAFSPKTDVALLNFYAADVPHLALGSTAKAIEGQRIMVIRNPEGSDGSVSEGIISAFRENRAVIQITAPISDGSSGSPVIDESGQVLGIAKGGFQDGQNLAISAEAIRVAVFFTTAEDETASNTAVEQRTAHLDRLPSESTPGNKSALIFKIDEALSEHDWATVTGYVVDGGTNYFGHRNATVAFIRKDMEGDAKMYRSTQTYPDSSTFRQTVKDGIVYESIEEQTEALEYNGRHHQARCLFGIAYQEGIRPSIISLSLKVLK
jgi:hypothetical protein